MVHKRMRERTTRKQKKKEEEEREGEGKEKEKDEKLFQLSMQEKQCMEPVHGSLAETISLTTILLQERIDFVCQPW